MFESVINPKAMLPPPLQLDECFYSATILLPAINETYSLRQTVETVLQASPDDVCQVLIIVCERTTPETMRVAADLASEHSGIVTVHTQRLPFVGGALREGFNLAKGSHVVMMASDLETDPTDVPAMIELAKTNPQAIITATRWVGGAFAGYNRVKLVANWIFQRLFALLYGVALTDMTYGYRLFPTKLVQSIQWEELRHPFFFETLLKPLRLGIPVIEIPSKWAARTEGESQNSFLRNFAYFKTGLRCRFMPQAKILK